MAYFYGMGSLDVRLISNRTQLNKFTNCLLKDIHALERMLEEGWFNEDPLHIGAEQELCLVDHHFKPAPRSLEVLKELNDKVFTTELAQFNLEANIDPLEFTGKSLSQMESNLNGTLEKVKKVCQDKKLYMALTGILPTIRKFDLDLSNLTPLKRYEALIKAISKMRGTSHELHIAGMDELNIKHDSAMLEACNTSFQVHMQVKPDEFVRKYNVAQVLAGPVLAAAVNSPMLFSKRLWAETRVALFQQSIDTRTVTEHIRDRSARVMFGHNWLDGSIAELYKEDITRFRVMLMSNTEDDPIEQVNKGVTPDLRALMIHNSTVYRWNRGCYGVSPNGKPHLRIENRVLPSGPSVVDEVANTAFWLGMMNEFDHAYPDFRKTFEFDHVKDNFMSAARDGLNTNFTWKKGAKTSVRKLITEELIPIARKGLERAAIDKKDISRYVDIISERVESRQTGTQWLIDSHTKLFKQSSREEVAIALTGSMIANQDSKKPIHKWKLASLKSIAGWEPYTMLVEEFMTTDLFTVQQNDIPEFVADMISWKRLKHIPVEDDEGKLKGLINYRILLEHYTNKSGKEKKQVVVKDLMIKNPTTIRPEATIQDALNLMKQKKVDCLPVVKDHKLCGIITEGNFLNIAASLLKSQENLNGKNSRKN